MNIALALLGLALTALVVVAFLIIGIGFVLADLTGAAVHGIGRGVARLRGRAPARITTARRAASVA